MNTDQEVPDKLRQYRISRIICLLWVNLFPYCFFFICSLIAPGYVILARDFIYQWSPFNLDPWLFVILQAIVMLLLIWGQVSQQNSFIPRNLKQWFFASMFVIFISLAGIVPPSFVISENPCPYYCDELQRIGVLGLSGRAVSNISEPENSWLIEALKDPTVRLVWCVRALCLILLLDNILLCGIWFTRTDKLTQILSKYGLTGRYQVLIAIIGVIVLVPYWIPDLLAYVIDSKLNDFDPYIALRVTPWLYSINVPETRKIAREWLARPFPADAAAQSPAHVQWDVEMGKRLWACLILLKGDSKDQELAVSEMRKLFNTIGLGKKVAAMTDIHSDIYYGNVPFSIGADLPFKVEELLKSNCKDVRQLACLLGFVGRPADDLEIIRVLFNAGCEDALKMLTNTLRINRATSSYHLQYVNGKEIKNWIGSGDIVGEIIVGQQWGIWDPEQKRTTQSNLFPDWGPPGFKFAQTEPEEVRKQKREELACWLEKKFQEVKQGKSEPLSTGPEHP